MWNLDRDKPIPAADILNKAITEVRRHGRLWVAPPLQCFFSPGIGWLIWKAPQASTMQTANTGPLIARVYASNGNAYAWTEQQSTDGINYTDNPNGASSDTQTDPAYELNGQANIPPRTLVRINGAIRLDGTVINVFNHPRHEHSMHLAHDKGRGNEAVARAYDFGIVRPSLYLIDLNLPAVQPSYGKEPAHIIPESFCSYCDTGNSVMLPMPFGNMPGIAGTDGIFSLSRASGDSPFTLNSPLPGGGTYVSNTISDGDTAAQVLSAILGSGTGLPFPFPNQGTDLMPFLTATGGPIGMAPVILTVHASPYLKILFQTLGPSILETVQPSTFGFILNGFYPPRLALSINGGLGNFTLHAAGNPPNEYDSFDAATGPSSPPWWKVDIMQYKLTGDVLMFSSEYAVSGVLPDKLQCWPLSLAWTSFTMTQTSGPGGDPATIGPFNATASGIY